MVPRPESLKRTRERQGQERALDRTDRLQLDKAKNALRLQAMAVNDLDHLIRHNRRQRLTERELGLGA